LAALVLRLLGRRIGVPALVGYVLLGLALALLDREFALFNRETHAVLGFLAKVGLVCLLFRVGIECDLASLVGQLGRAGWVWLGNVTLSGALGYLVMRGPFGYGLVTSLVVATALTATSLGVCVALWRDAGLIRTRTGGLVVDVAEMDDISGVVLMAILLALAPLLAAGNGVDLAAAAGEVGVAFALKAAFFAAVCLAFARYVEKPLMAAFKRLEPEPAPSLMLFGVGVIIAVLADGLGFSLAIGAFFAGLVFSRDPVAVKEETIFLPIHDFFAPFFFIGIGLALEPAALGDALPLALALLAAAVLGKVAGAGLPALAGMGAFGALLVGVTMVPRAEIAMVILHEGARLGPGIVGAEVYGAMVLVCLATSILAPLALDRLFAAARRSGEAERL
ncbi:MAG: cation:proton antiporter, partial [Rhodospirillaceae bacterium]|nr:cation:proton antiporter [Rhodospirillaceae bacterium]